jgi:uncharacterized protein
LEEHALKHWIFSAALLAAPMAHAAGFDCARASSPMEKRICADPALSKLDEGLNAAYARALARVGDKVLMRQWQRGWLTSAPVAACGSAACLRPLFAARIALLDDAIKSPWNGQYTRYVNNKPDQDTSEIMLVALKDEAVAGSGTTMWRGPNAANGQVHTGEFDAVGSFTGANLIFEQAECHVNVTRARGGLQVEDSNTCGGVNATFTGSYRRK